MGWANCGTDSNGRLIGYAHEATCDYPGCEEKINRGLDYACGGMHGNQTVDGQYCCEGYFCYKHLIGCEKTDQFVCPNCAKELDSPDQESAGD